MHNTRYACEPVIRINPLVLSSCGVKIAHWPVTYTTCGRALARGVRVFKTCMLYPSQSTHKRTTNNYNGYRSHTDIPYSVESLPENTERENEIFASKLIKSFESRSNQKGIFYITSLINFLLQLRRNALEERCQPPTTKVWRRYLSMRGLTYSDVKSRKMLWVSVKSF